jgi:hypothetical protein
MHSVCKNNWKYFDIDYNIRSVIRGTSAGSVLDGMFSISVTGVSEFSSSSSFLIRLYCPTGMKHSGYQVVQTKGKVRPRVSNYRLHGTMLEVIK